MAQLAVIDNDPDFVNFVRTVFEEEGWQVSTCLDEMSAPSWVAAVQPALILLDLRMSSPDSGWGILEALDLSPRTRTIPVILCTAAPESVRQRQGWLQEHGIAVLPKPFDLDELLRLSEAMVSASEIRVGTA